MVAVPTYRFVDSRGNFGGRRDLKSGSGVDAAAYADILVVEAQKSVDQPAAFANLMRQVRPAALAVNPRVRGLGHDWLRRGSTTIPWTHSQPPSRPWQK